MKTIAFCLLLSIVWTTVTCNRSRTSFEKNCLLDGYNYSMDCHNCKCADEAFDKLCMSRKNKPIAGENKCISPLSALSVRAKKFVQKESCFIRFCPNSDQQNHEWLVQCRNKRNKCLCSVLYYAERNVCRSCENTLLNQFAKLSFLSPSECSLQIKTLKLQKPVLEGVISQKRKRSCHPKAKKNNSFDFIALADRHAVTGFYHYSLQLWQGVTELPAESGEAKVEELRKRNPNAVKKAAVELLRHKSNWCIWRFNEKKNCTEREEKNLWVSLIRYSDSSVNFIPVYNPTVDNKAKVAKKWEDIRSKASSYPYAEQSENDFKNLPNSIYCLMIPGITEDENNSNTFILWLLNETNITYKKMSRSHPGRQLPPINHEPKKGFSISPCTDPKEFCSINWYWDNPWC